MNAMTPDQEMAAAMARLRRALRRRMQADERAEVRQPLRQAQGEGARGPLAVFDTAGLGRRLRPMIDHDGRGFRAVAAEMGVTAPDLSRVMAGQDVSAAKVFAICDWAGLDARKFYRAAMGAPPPRKRARPAIGRVSRDRH